MPTVPFAQPPPKPSLGSTQAAWTGLRERFGALPFPAAMG